MSIKFEDYTLRVEGEFSDAISAFLYEVGGELVAQIARNSRVDTGKTKGSYQYKVSESAMAGEGLVTVGSDYENAIWEEFGTGEYALHGDGRKGGWFYEDETGVGHFTRGKTPNRPMYKAFNFVKPKLQGALEAKLKQNLG